MIRISKSILLTGFSVLALAACSGDKGPGELGSKDDIVVRNNGMPGAQQQTAQGDFSSTVEQAEAVPAPEVASAEPLPDNSPAMEAAVEQHQAASAPLQSTAAATPADAQSAPPSETRPLDAVAPTEPVTAAPTPPPATTATAQAAPVVIPPTPQSAPSATGNVYPAAQAAPAPAAQVATQVSAPAATTEPEPATLAPGVKYPLDPNAPYSPKAVAAANAAATTTAATAPAAGVPSMTDPATIKAAQAALKAKGGYTGAESGEIDANFLNALTVYQGQNGLAQGGLNIDTLRSLGVVQ